MKKQNDRCPLQQECERTCKVVGHERDCDYYVNNRYSTGGIPDQDEILDDEEAARLEEIEKGATSDLSTAPSDPVIYQNEYSTLFAVREHKGAPALMCKPLASDAWTLSGVLAAVQGEAYTASALQEVLDEYARAHGWQKAAPEQTKKDYPPCEGCRCPDCDDEACPQAHCDKSDKVIGCIAPDYLCPPVNPTDAAAASPADAGVAAQNLCAAEPASLEAKDIKVPTFDFGADDDTNEALMQDAQIFMAGSMARVMAAKRAHDRTANNYRGSWGKWCDLVGISRDTGDNMVRVAEQFGNIQIDGQNLIDIQPATLLYAASKPSTPPEIRKKVENLDITTYKQYQDAMTRIRTLENQNASLLHSYETERGKAEAADRRADAAQTERDAADARARAAENRAAGAQKLAEQRGTENTDLIAKIRKLEDKPRDVAVVQPGEEQIEAWRREGADRMAATMQETVRKANEERLKAQNRVTYLQEQLATARPDADACQRTADTLYETAENLRILLRTQLKQAQLSPTAYGKVVAHVLQVARTLLDTVRVCAPDGYDIDSEEDDDFE